ncbi:hypothetical protein WA026_014740 [Henosepilachna vigintioctopunctata]|uniref:Membrane protein BRI3 n=1 Tax=Henosepilachna vigintioctopunctata TaxID=420089 RepID=A0AAW1VDZ3_9CUCU
MNKENPPAYPGNAPPPAGIYPYAQAPQNDYPYPQTQQPGNVTVVTAPSQPTVVVVGGCPTCRVGLLEDSYGCCAICLAICCFPVGLVCCYLMRERKCTNCGAVFN